MSTSIKHLDLGNHTLVRTGRGRHPFLQAHPAWCEHDDSFHTVSEHWAEGVCENSHGHSRLSHYGCAICLAIHRLSSGSPFSAVAAGTRSDSSREGLRQALKDQCVCSDRMTLASYCHEMKACDDIGEWHTKGWKDTKACEMKAWKDAKG